MQLTADRGLFRGCLSPRDDQSLGSKRAGRGDFGDDNDVGDDDDDDDDEDERDLVVDLERRGSPCHLSQANRLPASVFSRLEMMQRGKEDVEI